MIANIKIQNSNIKKYIDKKLKGVCPVYLLKLLVCPSYNSNKFKTIENIKSTLSQNTKTVLFRSIHILAYQNIKYMKNIFHFSAG